MSKETTIIFLYDTELLKKEEDDPNSAILYFYPTWVSELQKTALCGQLIGTVICLKSILASPKIVSLQTGKFYLIENGRYILVVGTDRNIPDWVLEHRTTLIYSLVKFFHKDFITLALLYQNENLTTKLYHIFDTYLKLLFLGGCVFSHMPLMDLSKTETDILTNARLFLDKCKTFPIILGGMLLYHNKIIHTQLSVQTSKKIAFSDPFRIKNPAELSDLNFEIPQGVKLLQVYIANEEYQDLFCNSVQDQNCTELQLLNDIKLDSQSESISFKEYDPPTSSSIKRDTSLLFTSVPEDATFSPRKEIFKCSQESRKNKRSRPNSLNLKSCSLDSAGDYHLGMGKTPITPYWRQSSTVCTPTNETKSFVDQPDVSTKKENFWEISMGFHKMNISQSMKMFRYPHLAGNHAKSDQLAEASQCYQTNCPSRPLEIYSKHLEKAERLFKFVQTALEKTSIYRSSSLSNISQLDSISCPLNQYSNLKNKIFCNAKKSISLKRRKSLHDPLYPWFKGEMTAASQYYVKDVLDDDIFIGKNEKDESTFRELITKRKSSLILPIKPHNASEAQKTDMKFPGGYCTPLMNKLSMPNSSDRRHSLNEIPINSFIKKDENKTEESSELRKCILFVYGERDLVLAILLTEECTKNKKIIEKLRHLCNEELPAVEEQVKSSIQPSKSETLSESDPYSILSFDADWDTLKRSGPWNGSDLTDLTGLHVNFNEHENINEIYLRKPESVLYGHREGQTEVFYQEAASLNNGLLPPNDALGTVHQTAKKRLEKYHDVFIK